MNEKPKVIAFTPAGRKRYMEILKFYVDYQHKMGFVDEWVLFENSTNDSDKAYLESLERENDWIKLYRSDNNDKREGWRIHHFYKMFIDAEAIYVRLDDDICYIAPHAIENLVAYRIAHPEAFLVYPSIVGNTRMAYYQQKAGWIPEEWGECADNILCGLTYNDPIYIANLHDLFLDRITNEHQFEVENVDAIQNYDSGHISINCFAMLGKDMIDLKDRLSQDADEERSLSQRRPAELNRFNAICGDAVVVHFAYHTQREELEKTNLLERYKQLTEKI